MITPPTACFYVVRAEGEAAEFVAATLSMGIVADIKVALLVSADYSNDVQAAVGLDSTVDTLKSRLLSPDLTEATEFNPLYIPSTQAAIDDVLDGDEQAETFEFTGMDGSPFTLKTVNVATADHDVIEGKVACKPFDLPSYSDIIAAQKVERLQ